MAKVPDGPSKLVSNEMGMALAEALADGQECFNQQELAVVVDWAEDALTNNWLLEMVFAGAIALKVNDGKIAYMHGKAFQECQDQARVRELAEERLRTFRRLAARSGITLIPRG